MKTILTALATTLALGAAIAQTTPMPANPDTRQNPQLSPGTSGGKAQMAGEAKKDASVAMGNKGMDMNGDGMISRKEWDAYHGKAWGGMKANKQGMVPWADVEKTMKGGGGPN